MDRREEEQDFPDTLLASSASLFSAGEHLEGTSFVVTLDEGFIGLSAHILGWC